MKRHSYSPLATPYRESRILPGLAREIFAGMLVKPWPAEKGLIVAPDYSDVVDVWAIHVETMEDGAPHTLVEVRRKEGAALLRVTCDPHLGADWEVQNEDGAIVLRVGEVLEWKTLSGAPVSLQWLYRLRDGA